MKKDLPFESEPINIDDYTPQICQLREELYTFLCQQNINPQEIILKGKLKQEISYHSQYRGVSKNAGHYQVQYYVNGQKEYFYSFQ